MIELLYEFTLNTWKRDLDHGFLHFSCHGAFVDRTWDDVLPMNVILPWDYAQNGALYDHKIHHFLSSCNPKTRLFCVFDCCHSAELANLPFKYIPSEDSSSISRFENTTHENTEMRSKNIITLSACRNTQTATGAYNLRNEGAFSGALTSMLLYLMKHTKDGKMRLSELLFGLHHLFKERGFPQIPVICASMPLDEEAYVFENQK